MEPPTPPVAWTHCCCHPLLLRARPPPLPCCCRASWSRSSARRDHLPPLPRPRSDRRSWRRPWRFFVTPPARFRWSWSLTASPMTLSTRSVDWNGRGRPRGGRRGHDRRRPQSPPSQPWLIVMFSSPPCSISAVDWNKRGQPIGRRKSHSRWHTWYRPCSCDEFLFVVFLAEALKKNTVCPVMFFLPPKELGPVFNLYSLIFGVGLCIKGGKPEKGGKIWHFFVFYIKKNPE